MDENLNKIKALCTGKMFKGNKSDEYLYTINCVDYFFYDKNIGQCDIRDGFTDGAFDGGIDFVYDDGNKMYLIQGKCQSNLTYNDIRDIYSKMLETVNNFKSGNTDDYSSKLKAIYKNTIDKLDEPEIEMILFTNTILTKEMISKIDDLNRNGDFQSYNLVAYGKDEIENKVLSVEDGNMCVPYGEIKLGSKKYLDYQNGIGAIFTIKAYSLKDLYEKKRSAGLFGYNLRELISQVSVDSQIDKTIQSDKDNFWYYNNGITIGCSDFDADGDKLKLWNFSIINGAQTTTKIGKSNYVRSDNDFGLVCKVIKSSNSLDDEFIRKISEASNSQKPIKPRDLKANSAEQKILQSKFIDNGKYQLAVEIKRGVKPSNYRSVSSWQRVNNEYIGQIILATQFQKPGTARSNKADIFGKDSIYNMIFSKDRVKNYDYSTLFDLVSLAHLYDEFKSQYVDTKENEIDESNDEDSKKNLNNLISVANNAKFVTIALISYFIKKLYFGVKDINDDNFSFPNITGDLSLNYRNDDYLKKINYLFGYIIDRLSMIYNMKEVQLKLTSHSNFFKTDKNYVKEIIPEFDKILNDEYDREKILDNIKIFDNNSNLVTY